MTTKQSRFVTTSHNQYRSHFEANILPKLREEAKALGHFITYKPGDYVIFVELYNDHGDKVVYYPKTARILVYNQQTKRMSSIDKLFYSIKEIVDELGW